MILSDLSAEEQGIAKGMYKKGYRYIVQLSQPDDQDFGKPLYFKSTMSVGPFLRDSGLKMKWTLSLLFCPHCGVPPLSDGCPFCSEPICPSCGAMDWGTDGMHSNEHCRACYMPKP